jgi:branched-subunit amino acid permease
MKPQHFKNHSQMAPKLYYTAILMALIVLILALINANDIINHWNSFLIPVLISVLGISIILIAWYARAFALKAQDRAIRAEENLRHFALTGKLLDNRLAISQIIALRFAADEEFVALAKKAVEENLTNKQIKQAIENWKADWYRV